MAQRDGVAGPRLGVVTILPPPITGQTLVSQAMCAILAERLPLALTAIRNNRGRGGISWTLRKHAHVTAALARLALGRLTARRSQRGYFVPDAGGGLWFNILQALVMRVAFEKVWFHHHVFSYVREPNGRMRAIHAILGHRLHHIALGETMARGLRSHYNTDQVTVLGNTPFVADSPQATARTRLRTLGFLGNITRDKGVGLFMEVAEGILASDPEACCRIAGPIRDPALRAEVESFCALDPERRIWLGPVRGDDKTAFLQDIDVLLFPSLYPNEALPMTIYEALAAGTPVLATSRGCIPDQLEGLGWDFPDTDFAEKATATMAEWRANPTAFAAASRTAAQQFETQLIKHRAALDRLVLEMAA